MLEIIIGFGMIALSVSIHSLGTAKWLSFVWSRKERQREVRLGFKALFPLIIETVTVLLLLHLFEVLCWALAYYSLPGSAGLTSFSEAAYFSIVTFTTLGYGDVTLVPDWRLLAGLEAMVGIILIGMSTALLFAIFQSIWKELHEHPQIRTSGP